MIAAKQMMNNVGRANTVGFVTNMIKSFCQATGRSYLNEGNIAGAEQRSSRASATMARGEREAVFEWPSPSVNLAVAANALQGRKEMLRLRR